MKDSGIEWIGEVPEDWEVAKVKHIFNRKNEKAKLENPVVLSLARSGVKVRDISNNEGQLAESYYNYNPVSKGDLLLNPMDLYSGANCSISNVEGVISPAYVNLRAKNNNNPIYYDYYFKTQYWSMALFAHGKGVSFDNRWTLNNETLMNYFLPHPNIKEQNIITEYINNKVKQIDNIISKTKETIEEYKKYKQSVITEAVTKGLNPNVEMKDSEIEWIGEIPKKWIVLRHKTIMRKKKSICDKYNGENILSLTLSGVIKRDLDNPSGKMPATFDGYQIVEKGNLLLCLFDIDVTPRCVGLINDNGLTSPAYSQFILLNNNNPRFYNYLLQMIDNYKCFVHLSKNLRNSLNENDFGAIKSIVPPVKEQEEIANYLDKKTKELENIVSKKQELITQLENYKKSLIYEYVTGKKEVSTSYAD